ncbi:MAG: hypothetical protein WBG41_00950 [Acidimicrobiales bacterium]
MTKRPGRDYHRGWTGKDYHATSEHEAQAKAAEEAKKPGRLGQWVLRKLGGNWAPPLQDPHHGAPHPPHPHHDD